MRTRFWTLLAVSTAVAITACVTINVYFPAAAAEDAAGQFIEGVIGKDQPSSAPVEPRPAEGKSLGARGFGALFNPIADARAEANLEIGTPAVKAIQARMAERFAASLTAHFDSGALGLTMDGLITLREPAAVPLPQRAGLNQAIADENRDRAAVYREIAVANGHPEWEADIRSAFSRQWIEKAHSGWYYQNTSGTWVRKP